jgi:hypothetical protein
MLSPNDLGSFLTVEGCRKIDINSLVREVRKDLKRAILEAKIQVFDQEVELTTTKTRFGGDRFWFLCPECQKRVGTLYQSKEKLSCRNCLNIGYIGQRYEDMLKYN